MEQWSGYIVDEISDAARVYDADMTHICEDDCNTDNVNKKEL